MTSTAIRKFNRFCLYTLIAVYFLIGVGGIVRSTGSGMGCPDWPKCFGQWVPPTSIEQLPADYKASYAALREKKNEKFARYLAACGFTDVAEKLTTDKTILEEADFNPVKTWVEYINRLIGVVVGLLIMGLVYKSWQARKENGTVFIVSLLCLVAVLIQGWLGSIVVSTNLTSWTITVHMFLALGIVGILVYLYHESRVWRWQGAPAQRLSWLLVVGIGLLLVQVFLGTEVRSAIDAVASQFSRDSWIERVFSDFVVHRSFSWLVLAVHGVLWLRLRKLAVFAAPVHWLLGLTLTAMATGAGMAYLAVPAYLQPLHLVVAVVLAGFLFLLWLRVNTRPAGDVN